MTCYPKVSICKPVHVVIIVYVCVVVNLIEGIIAACVHMKDENKTNTMSLLSFKPPST